MLAGQGLRLAPGLSMVGLPPPPAKGTKGPGVEAAHSRLRQGRGRQKQAPSGLTTQAQRGGCPPTWPLCAQTPWQLDGWSWACGRDRAGGAERVGCWAATRPEVPTQGPGLGPDSWMPLVTPGSDSSQGGGQGWAPAVGRGAGRTQCSIWGVGKRRSPPSQDGWGASAVTQAAAEQALPQPAPGPGFLPVGGPDSRAQGRRQTGQREMGCPGHPEITDSNTPGEGEGGTSHALLGHHL